MPKLLDVCKELDEMFGADKGHAEQVVFKRLANRNPTAEAVADHEQDVWSLKKTSDTSAVVQKVEPGRRDEIHTKWTVLVAKYRSDAREKVGFCLNVSPGFSAASRRVSQASQKVRRLAADLRRDKRFGED